MMFYYYKVDSRLRIVPSSNFASRVPVRDKWAVPFLPQNVLCCNPSEELDTEWEFIQNSKEKWYLRLDSKNKPVNHTLVRFQVGMNIEGMQQVFLPTCCPQLAAPTLLVVTNGNTIANITFTNAAGADNNTWQVSTNPDFSGATTSTDFTSPFNMTGLTNGTTYYVRARSTSSTDGTTSKWSPTVQVLPTAGQLLAPTSLSGSGGDTTGSVSWTAAANATSYQWQLATDSGFTNIVQSGTDTATPTPMTGLNNGQLYYFRMRSLATGWTTSAYSATATFTPAAVTYSVYYGTKNNGTDLNESQILDGVSQPHTLGNDISILYATNSPLYHWAAWPLAETGIDNYYVNFLDFGGFGGGSVWHTPIVVGNFYFTITDYATQYPSPDPVQFKH